MTDAFLENDLLIHASRIARKFHQDVIRILKSPADEWLMWDAAYRVILNDEKEQADREKAAARKK